MKHKTKSNNDKNEDFSETTNFSATKKWHEEITEDPSNFPPVTDQTTIELQEEAKKCHDAEATNYNIKNDKTNSDFRWMKTIMSKGTLSDKIAAFTVSIQDNPVCALNMLQNIVSMVKVGKKKECLLVIETLTELFLNDLLRPDQKLKSFQQRPLFLLNEMSSGNAITRRKLLSLWYFEDQLKETYKSFIQALNAAAHDSVESNKEKAISAMYKLLSGNPEQEKVLLSNIVNKLGDPSQKVASKAIYCLGQLLFKHSNMQGVVLNEVEKLLFRPNIAQRAQYYGLCFLSQFYLSHENNEIAKQLIKVYFSFFKACIKKGEIDSRMMSVLLMGINRAYPYAKLELDQISEHIDTLYRVVHVASFNVSLHTLCLLYQVSDHTDNLNDRFYSALYKKLADPQLINTTHQAMLLNLIYKALLKDEETSRVKVFVKRLLQIALLANTNFSCSILYLISQLIDRKKNIQAFILQQSNVKKHYDDDDGEEKYTDVIEKPDDVSETSETKIEDDETKTKSTENKKTNVTANEDIKPDIDILNSQVISGSWYHGEKQEGFKVSTHTYLPLSRNPIYAGGDFCFYSELNYLKYHYHPTVSLFAQKIINGEIVAYTGDPLKDFTLMRFLDRFVFKNPKKVEDLGKHGAHPTFGKRKNYKVSGIKALPVTSGNYLKEKQDKIPVDELFLFNYLKRKEKDKASKEDNESDAESVASEEFEELLDKMGGGRHKDLDDDSIDFLSDIGNSLNNNKNRIDENGESDGSEDEVDENENAHDKNSVDNIDEDGKDLMSDLDFDDDDISDVSFASDDELSEQVLTKKAKSKKNKTNKGDPESLFASAEEFASILEDEGSSSIAPGSSNAISNRDNADQKQIAWESKRNKWIKNVDRALGKKTKRNSAKANNKYGNKRQYSGNSKIDSNSKRRKR